MECLSELPMLIPSLSSVSDAVQRSEQTEGGYLFTKREVGKSDAVPSDTSTISRTLTSSTAGLAEVDLK